MAKKQSATEKKSKPAAKSTAKPVKKAAAKQPAAAPQSLFNDATDEPKPAKPAAKKSTAAAAPARPLTVEEIGHAAGEVWGALSAGNGGVSLATLKKSVAAPADLVLLALGWLAREDKIDINASAKTPTISLK
ncbi:MAG: winged helix-turn-helix domain-containing protein [Planctomycetaceae bacterium]|nr:winged helix-turn-helix domain-containing protein [Planctomycetaceae bacterium]